MIRALLYLFAWALGGLVASFWFITLIQPSRVVEVTEWHGAMCPQKVYGAIPQRDATFCRVKKTR